MPLTLYTADGQLIVAEDGPPWQYTPEGFNTFLSASSVPLQMWAGAGGSYAQLYETQPWVAAVVNKLVRQIVRLPLKVYEPGSQPGEKKRVYDGPLVDALKRPAARKGPVDLKQWLAFPALLHGNGLVRKRRPSPGSPPVGFDRLDWRSLEPRDEDEDGVIDFWVHRQSRGRKEIILPDDVLHLAWLAPAGDVGVSPLKQLGVTLRIEQAAQQHQEAALRNNARPSGGFKLDKDLATDKVLRAELRDDVGRMHTGASNRGRPMILPGAEWQPFAHTNQEAELVEQRQLTREEACAVYDIPPPMVGILDDATFSNITEQHKMLFTTVLGPWLTLIEETVKAQVIDTEPQLEGQFVEFELKEVLRGDPIKEAMALKTYVGAGLLTINEARAILNLAKIDHPDADRPMIPVNNVAFIGDDTSGDDPEGPRAQLARMIEQTIQTRALRDPDFRAAAAAAFTNGDH